MPLYEYYCTECDLKFDLLQRMNEAGKSALCPSCHQKAEQVISPFYHFNEPTYIQKKKEDLADHLLDIEQKKEREPHLNWDKHLEGAKRRIAGQRAMKKEIERVAGKGSNASDKYRDIMKVKSVLKQQDRWNVD